MGLGKVGQRRDCLANQLDGPLGPALAQRYYTEQVERVGIAGRLAQNLSVEGGRPLNPPGPMMLEGNRQPARCPRLAPSRPLPDIKTLLLDVAKNQKAI